MYDLQALFVGPIENRVVIDSLLGGWTVLNDLECLRIEGEFSFVLDLELKNPH